MGRRQLGRWSEGSLHSGPVLLGSEAPLGYGRRLRKSSLAMGPCSGTGANLANLAELVTGSSTSRGGPSPKLSWWKGRGTLSEWALGVGHARASRRPPFRRSGRRPLLPLRTVPTTQVGGYVWGMEWGEPHRAPELSFGEGCGNLRFSANRRETP